MEGNLWSSRLHDRIDVWWTALEVAESTADALAALLSADEQERAARFVFERDRRRFIVAHGTLRAMLADYVGCAPRALRFEREAFGRPRLADGQNPDALDFNLAHSHEVAVYAIAYGRRLGIDLEYVRPIEDLPTLARVAFSAAEQARLTALPPAERVSWFFDQWTWKEAYLKARGDGLSAPLQVFDIALDDDQLPTLRSHRLDPLEVERWWFERLAVAPGYSAALCAQHPPTSVAVQRWPPTRDRSTA
jgi:4'-phosphopantetheinyl transferase